MNSYEKKNKKDETIHFLNDIEGTASDRSLPKTKRILKGTGSGILKIGSGLVGGIVGAGFGTWSLIPGIITATAGEVLGSGELTAFGVGCIASGVIPDTGLNGADDGKTKFQKAKERMRAYSKGIMKKFWLDKLVKKKTTGTQTTNTETTTMNTAANTNTTTTNSEQTTNGMGEVKYYTHPQGEPDPVDLAELERYERQVKESGENFAQQNGMTTQENMSGVGDDDAYLGNVDEEKIY